MATGADQVSVTTLADWIIQAKADFRVVDLRPEAAYAEYHIPPAENIPVAGLAQSSLRHNEKVILYAEDGARAAQAWMLLRAKGFKGVYILRGGLEAWKDSVLFPRVPGNPDAGPAGGVRAGQGSQQVLRRHAAGDRRRLHRNPAGCHAHAGDAGSAGGGCAGGGEEEEEGRLLDCD